MKKTVIGLTGGIASGKSSVSSILAEEGCRIVDCDKIARQVVEKGKPALNELVQFFGREILDRDGNLNRSRLASIVFGNDKLVMKLNEITHKYIIEVILKEVELHRHDKSYDILVIDAPIPVEHGFIDQSDEIWVVTADLETRIRRIQMRDGISEEEARKRISSQLSDEQYLKIADRIIYNNAGMEQLKKTVLALLSQLKNNV